ncbi:MAG: DUF1146 family protein [Enterococcus sp.]
MQVYGVDIFVRITSHLAFIYLAFWSLKSIRLETFFKNDHHLTTQIRMVIVFIAIALGYIASTFFLELIMLCKNLFVSF